MKFKNFSNKHIVITGSSSGVGLEMALQAIRKGAAALAITGSNPLKLEEAEKLCREAREKADTQTKIVAKCFDLSIPEQIQTGGGALLEEMPQIDVLINNAGLTQRSKVLDTNHDTERYLMQVNFWSAVELTRLVLPQMVERRSGYIGVMSSIAGIFGIPFRSSYCATKHALNGYFLSLLSEYYQEGIRVSILCPGKIDTALSKSALMGDGSRYGIVNENPKGVGISPERCARIFWRAVQRERVITYAAKLEHIMILLHRLSPQRASALMRKITPFTSPKRV